MDVNIGDERVNQTVSLQIAGTFHSSTVDLAEIKLRFGSLLSEGGSFRRVS